MPGFELIDNNELKQIKKLFNKTKKKTVPIFYNSKKVLEFEKKFASYLGVKYCVAVSSGTAAIKTSLIAAGVKRGDEVITQSFTFIATVEAIMDIGAIPVITDIDETLNMCPIDLEKKITNRTRAIIPVHMLGVACDLKKILEIARRYKINVIDDNCEALGARWGKEKLGIQSDACTWSFDNGKTITTGEGGMISTNKKKIYKLCKEYRDHGHQNNPKYPRGRDTHRIYGFNFRTTELNAAIGIEQLKKLNYIVKKNSENYKKFFLFLKNYKSIKFRKIPKNSHALNDCLIFFLKSKNLAYKLSKLMKEHKLQTKNLPDAIEWHFAKYWDHIFKKTKKELSNKFTKSSYYLEKSIAIPIFVKDTNLNINRKISKLKKIFDILNIS